MVVNQVSKVGMTQEPTSALLRDPLHVNNHLKVPKIVGSSIFLKLFVKFLINKIKF